MLLSLSDYLFMFSVSLAVYVSVSVSVSDHASRSFSFSVLVFVSFYVYVSASFCLCFCFIRCLILYRFQCFSFSVYDLVSLFHCFSALSPLIYLCLSLSLRFSLCFFRCLCFYILLFNYLYSLLSFFCIFRMFMSLSLPRFISQTFCLFSRICFLTSL